MSWTLVTGGARRLGAELCKRCAKEGHSVVVHYNTSQQEAESVAADCRTYGVEAQTIQGDFSSQQGVDAFIKEYLSRFPDTDVVINNVGNYLIKGADDTSVDEWIDIFQTNLHAPFAISRALGPALKKNKGVLINIGVNGLEAARADLNSTAYTLSKAGLLLLTKALAKQWAGDEVRVNMVSPGLLENAVDYERVISKVPMKTATTLHEIANIVAFLLNPENHHLTGQNIESAGALGL